MTVVLGALYGYLYVLLQLEDYALLMGSVGLFVILALVMFLTRQDRLVGPGLAGPVTTRDLREERSSRRCHAQVTGSH